MLKVLVPLNGYVTSQCGARHVVNEFVKNQNMEIQIFNVQAPFSGHFTGYARTPARSRFIWVRPRKRSLRHARYRSVLA